jgi:hypothetical protein
VTAVLGASIRPAGGRWLDDPTGDRRITAPPGRSTHSRPFRVPDSAAGTYEVWANLLSPDLGSSYGQRVVSSLRVETAGPARPAAPQATAASPADAVRRFYAAISARELRTAWDLLSPRYRGGTGYDAWAAGYANTRSVQTPSVSVASQAGAAATVAVTIVSVDAQGVGTVTKRFEGTWALVLTDGAWKLDRPSIRQAQ